MTLKSLLESLSAIFASLFTFLIDDSFFIPSFGTEPQASDHVARFAFGQVSWLQLVFF